MTQSVSDILLSRLLQLLCVFAVFSSPQKGFFGGQASDLPLYQIFLIRKDLRSLPNFFFCFHNNASQGNAKLLSTLVL
jgi:hypothetical protein